MYSIIEDGNAILNGVKNTDIGCDTVILHEADTLYICAHLKDYKPGQDKFVKQMKAILSIVGSNRDKKCILMMDANTQFKLNATLDAFSKDPDVKEPYTFDLPTDISAMISEFPTSNKIRGPHTAQIDKSLKSVKAIIDHIFLFNGKETIVKTKAYTLDNDGDLKEITNHDTPTTSPSSIADHAFVISTTSSGISYGNLNIKGGNAEDQAWAEFIPYQYVPFFTSTAVKNRLDVLLQTAFDQTSLANVKKSGYTSTPRFSLFDINLPNNMVPRIEIVDKDIYIIRGEEICVLKKQGAYTAEGTVSGLEEWIDQLLKELTKPAVEEFFLSKGHKLLNYWYLVQTDTEPLEGKTLKNVYEEWYTKSTVKKTIGDMILMAKKSNPSLRIISIQELPNDGRAAQAVLDDIKRKNPSCELYHRDLPLSGDCVTAGAILTFPSNGGRRSRRFRKSRKHRRYSRRR